MALLPAISIGDITHLILQNLLAQLFPEIPDWQNFNSSLMPPSDGSYAYAGAIYPISYSPSIGAYSRVAKSQTLWGIRLMLCHYDVAEVTLAAHRWARYLGVAVAAVGSTSMLDSLGVSLAGNYEGFEVLPGTTLGIQRERNISFSLSITENESGGGLAVVEGEFLVVNG